MPGGVQVREEHTERSEVCDDVSRVKAVSEIRRTTGAVGETTLYLFRFYKLFRFLRSHSYGVVYMLERVEHVCSWSVLSNLGAKML